MDELEAAGARLAGQLGGADEEAEIVRAARHEADGLGDEDREEARAPRAVDRVDEEEAARTQQARRLGHDAPPGGDVLEEVGGEDQVGAPRGERRPLRVGAHVEEAAVRAARDAVGLRGRERGAAELDADDARAAARERLGEEAAAAAEVDHRRRAQPLSRPAADQLAAEVVDRVERAKPRRIAIPPVARVRLEDRGVARHGTAARARAGARSSAPTKRGWASDAAPRRLPTTASSRSAAAGDRASRAPSALPTRGWRRSACSSGWSSAFPRRARATARA